MNLVHAGARSALLVIHSRSQDIARLFAASEESRLHLIDTVWALHHFRYVILATEVIVYVFKPGMAEELWTWAFYAVGNSMTFLPLTILAWRLRLVYIGPFDWRKMSFVAPVAKRSSLKCGDKWLLTRLALGMLLFLALYLLIYTWPHMDAVIIAAQSLVQLFFLFTILQLFSQKKRLQQHALDQTWTLLMFWMVVAAGDVYTNLAWYAFHHLNNTALCQIVTLAVIDVQVVMIFFIWYTSYRIMLRRDGADPDLAAADSGAGLPVLDNADRVTDPGSCDSNDSQGSMLEPLVSSVRDLIAAARRASARRASTSTMSTANADKPAALAIDIENRMIESAIDVAEQGDSDSHILPIRTRSQSLPDSGR